MKVLKFYADWCGPCKTLSKMIDEMDDVGVEIINVDIDKDQDTAIKYTIRGVPTLVVIDDAGVEIRRKSGTMTEASFKALIS